MTAPTSQGLLAGPHGIARVERSRLKPFARWISAVPLFGKWWNASSGKNILYDGGGLPDALRDEMMAWCLANSAEQRKPGETDEQFLYKTRKKAIGPFKPALWTLPPDAQEQIGANLRAKFGILFDRLGVAGTRSLVDQFVTTPDLPRPLPMSLGGVAARAVVVGASVFEDDGSGE